MIRAVASAHNSLLDLEELDNEEIDRIRANYEELARQARENMKRGLTDTNSPDV